MSWLDMLTMTVAAWAAFECVTARVCAMHPRKHRATYQAGYLLASVVCILAASMIWQQMDVRWLDWAAWGVAAHLLFSRGDWRDGPPLTAYRAQPQRQRAGDLIPSGFDDGRR